MNPGMTLRRWMHWALGVGGLLAGGMPVLVNAQGPSTATTPNIEVTGTGHIFAKPDAAIASVGVDVTAVSLAAALKQANDDASKLVAVAKAQGIADNDIQTSAYTMNPVTDQDGKVTGYRVNYQYNIKIRVIDSVGKVMDAIVAAGASSLNGITFTIDDPSKYETDARTAAVKDALAKAQTLAAAAGVRLGPIISITEQSGGVMPVYRAAFGMMGNAPGGAPVEAGQNDVSVSVEVHYQIL